MTTAQSKLYSPVNGSMEDQLVISSRLEEIPRVRAHIRHWLGNLDVADRDRRSIVFCLMEAVVNAINHGNKRDAAKQVIISIVAGDGNISLTVTDEGSGFDPHALPDPTSPEQLANPTGRGVFFMHQMMTSVNFDFSGSGTKVTMSLQYRPED